MGLCRVGVMSTRIRSWTSGVGLPLLAALTALSYGKHSPPVFVAVVGILRGNESHESQVLLEWEVNERVMKPATSRIAQLN